MGKGLAPTARGYTFQDVIGGCAVLSVVFEEAEAVAIEDSFQSGDKFDDLILEQDSDQICFQVKNRPGQQLNLSDLENASSKFYVDNFVDSARDRFTAGEGSRFVILTSHLSEPGADVDLEDEREVSFFGDLRFPTKHLANGDGEVFSGTEIEYIMGVPGIDTADDNELAETIQDTDLVDLIEKNVAPIFDELEHPEISEPKTLVTDAIDLARWARNHSSITRLTREDIVRRLGYIPTPDISQEFPVQEGYIEPRWVQDLEDLHEDVSRLLIEGGPGSGKSTGIELLHREWSETMNKRALWFFLYVPDDAEHVERKRNDPAWFRHQLAAQLHSSFPEAFADGVAAPVWTGTQNLQEYIDSVANWAIREDQQPLFIIDGLDHALRSFGDTAHGDEIENTVLEELTQLDFPSPLTLIMVSRPLSTELHEDLRISEHITVPEWETNEITRYLQENDVSPTDDLVERVESVSGGLPVILSHLLRKATTSGSEVQEGLRLALDEASEVDGKLEQYYETVWKPLRPHERDAANLVALNPTGIDADIIDEIINLPWTRQELSVDEMPLSHILDKFDGRRLQVFHDSFRSFVLDQVSPDEIEEGHEQIFDHLVERCEKTPTRLDSLTYHAENGPGHAALKDLVSLDQVLQWWENGAHVDQVLQAINLAFDASLREGDYTTAFDCTILGGVTRDMLDIYADDTDRLAFYTARGNRDAAIRLVNAIREYNGGTEEALSAMRTVAQEWEGEVEREWMRQWENDYREAEQPSWDPEAYFELGAILLHPDEFWDIAQETRRADTGEHFPREVLATVRHHPDLIDYQVPPPDWLFKDSEVALEACGEIDQRLPDSWREELRENAPPPSDVSIAGLHTLFLCGGPQDEIVEIIDDQRLAEPKRSPTENESKFSDAYYIGAILASYDRSPDEVLSWLADISAEHPKVHQFIALVGAATTRGSSDETGRWVDATLEFLEQRFNDRSLADESIQNSEHWKYRASVEAAVKEFEDVIEKGSTDQVQRVHELANDTHGETENLLPSISWELVGTYPDDMLPQAFDEQFEKILKRPPDEEPPARALTDLAYNAAEAGYPDYADHYFDSAIERCFRYGYRKDVFLNDVWKGFRDVAGNDWDRHMGTAIQLINWARLLHELTDGKETLHYEGMFLTDLLDKDLIDIDAAFEGASNQLTLKKLRNWRLDNPSGITHGELRAYIDAQRAQVLTNEYTDKKIRFFGRTAKIAANHGWEDLVTKSLVLMNAGEYVDEGVSGDLAETVEELVENYDVKAPENLRKEEEDEPDIKETNEVEVPAEQEELHRLFSDCSEEDPLSEDDFRDLSTYELRTAGRLLQERRYWYEGMAAVPLAHVLADQEGAEEAVDFLVKIIAEHDLMSWYIGGPGFERLADALIDISQEDALEAVLRAWRRSSIIDEASYQSTFPQLIWIVKRTEGQIAAEELLSHTMQRLRRLFWPYEDRVQVWGKLSDT
ncbi:NACHT domain-containing protein [Haladaptatus sp. F3-133]|uniref:NACHT domain-containing protein n=1 Tax=Halorutilus salinus TaxID=2487751 RepID=A0A9Q4GH55_9EURY|nr:NACHT domain-containing protein [Halorutilus salinus]MCX2819829.1 NACHT domain-containing protein [Halorutilus salinus]